MPEEIIPGLFRLIVPMPNDSLGHVNVYAVMGTEGLRLIDSGWEAQEAYTAIAGGLQELGMRVHDIREVLVTHAHPDHIGLAERFVQETRARLSMHRLEALGDAMEQRDGENMLAEMETWLATYGMPPNERETIMRGMRRMPYRRHTYHPDIVLEGGETLDWSPLRFEVIWTPGHAPGLLCLYEAEQQILLSSDHILERISPNIGLYDQQGGDPLGDYLSSLQRVRDLPVKLVVPGHGAPFSDLAGRVDALLAHHEQRLQSMLDVLSEGEQTSYQIASRLSWRGSQEGWQKLQAFDRLAALSETLSHLNYLVKRDSVEQDTHEGRVVYRKAATSDIKVDKMIHHP